MTARRALLAALALALTAPATASAADVLPGNYVGGGGGDEPGLAFVSIDEDATTYVASFTVRAPCEAYDLPVQARIAVPATRLTDDGTSTVVRPVTGTARGPGGQQADESGEATFNLTVADDGTATGTARLRSTFTDAQTGAVVAQCDTGEQAFRVAIVPSRVSTRNGAAPRSADYLGAVGVQPLVARLRGGDLQQITVLYRSGCQRRATGSAISRIVAVPRLDLKRNVIAFRARGFNRLFSADGEEAVRFEIAARFGRRGALSGTIRYRGTLTDNDGDVIARCDSGALRFRALPVRG
jgi:hypothetical protein